MDFIKCFRYSSYSDRENIFRQKNGSRGMYNKNFWFYVYIIIVDIYISKLYHM